MKTLMFTDDGWIRLLEDVFGVSISDKMDSVDIFWDGLYQALFELKDVEWLVLKLRYSDGLTWKECGRLIPNRNVDKKGSAISKDRARAICIVALHRLRHPKRISMLRSCIAGSFNIR